MNYTTREQREGYVRNCHEAVRTWQQTLRTAVMSDLA